VPTIALTGRTVSGLNCPLDTTEITYWSSELPGFGLRCRSSGARTWFVQYRTRGGETRKHSLGDPKNVAFAKARSQAGRLIAGAKLGADPAGDAKEARSAIKFGELAARYLKYQKTRLKPRSYEEARRHLERHASPLHHQAAGRVTQQGIVELLQSLAGRAPITANRTRANLSAMFVWAMKAGLVSANPVSATFKPAQERSRERVLTDSELALIWPCTSSASDHDRIVRLLILTGARREEIAGMRWDEIAPAGDGEVSWALPGARAKNGRPQLLVLPSMAAKQLPAPRETPRGQRRELIFGSGKGPFSGWSNCKARLDTRIANTNGGKSIPAWVLHDLRRTFVTRLNDLGVEPHVIEALVNHVGGTAKAGIAGVYNRSAYAPQKRAALALWCDHMTQLAGDGGADELTANEVPLRGSG
jgi:integrase